MNEKLNLLEILKDCPKGTKLYSTIYGDVKFERIDIIIPHPIVVRINETSTDSFAADGKLFREFDGECVLFPSKKQRDWSKFNPKKPKQPKFDPKTLQPFDKVLVKTKYGSWKCGLFSNINDEESEYKYFCVGSEYTHCIPYNDDTKHLVGTSEEAPEYYKYWED